jgi:hypothetical protein
VRMIMAQVQCMIGMPTLVKLRSPA